MTNSLLRCGSFSLLSLILCCGCSNPPATTPQPAAASAPVTATAPAPSAADQQSDEDKTVLAVSKAIREKNLVSQSDECLAYQFDGKSSAEDFLVDVRENHRNPKCGGDPNTEPRLFSVRVSKKTGAMTTDAHSLETGEFRPLEK